MIGPESSTTTKITATRLGESALNRCEAKNQFILSHIGKSSGLQGTPLIPQDQEIECASLSKPVYENIKAMSIPTEHTFQSFLLENKQMAGYLNLCIRNSKKDWFAVFFDPKHSGRVDMICHGIMNRMTELLIDSINAKEKQKKFFEVQILSEFQKNEDCFLRNLFQDNFPELPNQDNNATLCQMMIMITLKNYFIDTRVRQAISDVKKDLTSDVEESKTDNTNDDIILNDDEVNKIFGWALYKGMKKYIDLYDRKEEHKQHSYKIKILKYMCIKIRSN